jgi:hypothetical protein
VPFRDLLDPCLLQSINRRGRFIADSLGGALRKLLFAANFYSGSDSFDSVEDEEDRSDEDSWLEVD